MQERYFGKDGKAYLDIEYTCHGNNKKHVMVPHIHKWIEKDYGRLERQDPEEFI